MKKIYMVIGCMSILFALLALKKDFQLSSSVGISKSKEEEEGTAGDDDKWKRDSLEFEKTKDPALGYVPGNRMYQAVQYTQTLKESRIANGAEALSWTARGPIFDTVGPSNGNGRAGYAYTSGYMSAVLIDTLNDPSGNTVLCASTSGGVWKCTNFLSAFPNWAPVNDSYQTLAVTSLCQDPSSPNTMYFTTGDGYYSASFITGGGIWRSSDGGNNWVKLPGTDNFYRSFKIICDASGNVYAGLKSTTVPVIQRFGLFRSKDHGNTWTNITPAVLTSSDSSCTDIEISSTGRLHASFGYAGTVVNHRYTDDPANVTPSTGWNSSTGIRSGVTPPAVTRMELAVSGNTAYALTINSSQNADSCYKSTDGGVTWTKQNVAAFPTGVLNSQGEYDVTLAINPDNQNEIIVGGLDAYKSSNAGNSFGTRLTYWVRSAPTDSPYVHADHHFMQWLKVGTESRIVIGGDGGIFLSRDGGSSFQDRNRNLNIKQFYSGAIHPAAGSPYLLGGAQDNGTHQLKNPGLSGSYEVTGGDGAFVHINQQDPNIQFGAYTFSNYRRTNDGGQTWQYFFLNPNAGLFTNPFDYDDGKNIMYASTSPNKILRWKDADHTDGDLAQLLDAPQLGGNVSAVKFSPYTQNRLYVGSDHGKLLRVDNINTVTNSTVAANTTDITGAAFVPGAYLNCVNIGSSEQYLVAVFTNFGINNVWYSSDGGASWTAIDGNLPDMPIRWALFDPQHNEKLFIATNAGVYYTNLVNGASTNWVPETGLPTVRTDMLQLRLSDNTMLAATYGRGMWTSVIPSTPEIRFTTPSLSVTETTSGTTGGCRNYKDYVVNVSSVSAPTGNAIVNYSVQGGNTATQGIDFDFTTNGDFTTPSSQHTFTSGLAETKPLTVRIYDDAEVESTENFTIGFTITGSTDAIAGSAQTFSVIINDNDVTPQVLTSSIGTVGAPLGQVSTLFDATLQRKKAEMLYSASELNAAGIVAGRITSIGFFVNQQRSTRPYQNLQIKMKAVGLNYLLENSIYQGAFPNLVQTLPSYTTIPGWNTFMLDSVFNWDGISNIAIDICYNNVVADPLNNSDVINVISDPNATQFEGNLFFQNNIGCNNNFTTGSYYFNGVKPQIQFGTSSNGVAVASNLNASHSDYLPGNGDEFFYSSTGQLLARITNLTNFNYGCTQVVIDRAGTASSAFWNSNPGNFLMNKTFRVIPSNNNPTGMYQVTLYFTQAEKLGWEAATGQSWNSIQLIKVNGQINQVSPGNPGGAGSVEIVTPTRGTFGNDYTLTYTFNSGFSGFGAGVAGLALPVGLLDFTGRLQNNSVVLNWKTSFELNSQGFDIEKSYDGQTFEKIGYVAAAGLSNVTLNYQFKDEMIAQENNYYRLKQIDLDGRFDYSRVVLIKDPLDQKFVFRVMNNPFNTSIDIQFGKISPGKVQARLMDMNGSVMMRWDLNNVSLNRVRLQLGNKQLASAVYVLNVVVGNKEYVQSVLKK